MRHSKIKILSFDGRTTIELDGKSISAGLHGINFSCISARDSGTGKLETRLTMTIDPSEFHFMKDGQVDRDEKIMNECVIESNQPPDKTDDGRVICEEQME